ncbi:MAG: PQQ-binding-like beta-propeller repeat protein [Planctomycetota bacterium]
MKLKMLTRYIVLFCCLVSMPLASMSSADDWSQWLGNDGNSEWNESGILTSFPENGPNVLWRADIASGYAGPAVVGNHVFVADYVIEEGENRPDPSTRTQLKGIERIVCLDAASGEMLWKYEHPCEYAISYAYGPRATPTVNDGHVYGLGAEGHLCCLNAETGDVVWSKELKDEYNLTEAPIWGFAAHPMIAGDTLYTIAGGEGSVVVALDKKTGEQKWSALSAENQGYCPPVMINAGGVDQLIVWHPESVNGLNPENGEVYWSVELEPAYAMSIIAPQQYEDFLLVTGLQGSSLLLRLHDDEPAVTEVWRGKGIHPDHNPPVIVDGYIYGVDVNGRLRCIDLERGERVWESMATCPDGRPQSSTTGFVVKNGDQYFLANELGELILAKMSPDGFEEVGRTKVLEPTSFTFGRDVVWSHPAFANKCVYWRNDKEIVCISLAE